MRIAFIIYDEMTALDFIGVYGPLTRLKTMHFMSDLEWEICAISDTVVDSTWLRFTPTKVMASLKDYDMIVVPGGSESRKLARDDTFIKWLQTAVTCKYKVSVCTESLLLGAAGFLKGRRATTHRTEFESLRGFCAVVVDERIVDEGDVITARGVTSSIDLGLNLCEKLAGYEAEEKIRKQMDYYRPPWEPTET